MRFFLLPLPVLALAGCAGLHSNVSGSFQCGAARGTCEPTTSIDDRALAEIARTKRASVEPTVVAPMAGDMSDLSGYPLRKARVVFPGYTDDKGRIHESYVVTVPLHDGWSGVSGNASILPAALPSVPAEHASDALRDAVAGPAPTANVAAPTSPPIIVGRMVPAQPAPGAVPAEPQAKPASVPQPFPVSTTVHP